MLSTSVRELFKKNKEKKMRVPIAFILLIVGLVFASNNCPSGMNSANTASVLFHRIPNSIKAAVDDTVCDDIGTYGECCLTCDMPRFRYKPNKGKRVCTCQTPGIRFRWSTPFTNYLYPCWPERVVTPKGVLWPWVGDFIQFCIQRGCTCVDLVVQPSPLVLFPGSLRPTGPLTSPYIISRMENFVNQLNNDTLIEGKRKEEIRSFLNYFLNYIYKEHGLNTTTNKDTLKKYIHTLYVHRNDVLDFISTLHATGAVRRNYMLYYDTILSEIYRCRTYFINMYRATYPKDKAYTDVLPPSTSAPAKHK
jgi:hypothetical protein